MSDPGGAAPDWAHDPGGDRLCRNSRRAGRGLGWPVPATVPARRPSGRPRRRRGSAWFDFEGVGLHGDLPVTDDEGV
jgi:hypothetical protein